MRNLLRGFLLLGGLASSFLHAQQPGSLDTNYVTLAGTDLAGSILVPAGNGQLYVGGNFANYGGAGRAGLVRLAATGHLDPTFTLPLLRKIIPAVIVNGSVLVPASTNAGQLKAVLPLGDGRVVIAGSFSHVDDATAPGVAVLQADGRLATGAFAVSKIDPGVLLAGPNGTFYVGGQGNVEDTRLPLLRFHSDGLPDAGFTPPSLASLGYLSSSTYNLLRGPGDTLYVVTAAALPSFTPTFDIVRVTATGALDPAFADGGKATIPNPSLGGMVSTAEGQLVFNGLATYRGVSLTRKINRLALDGSLDASFTATVDPGFGARVVAVQADGKVLHTATSIPINRLNANGTVDTGYANPVKVPVQQLGLSLTAFALAPDQSLFASGTGISPTFTILNGVFHIFGDPSSGPTIATEPEGQTNTLGARTRFSVIAQGAAPLTYQWFRNDVAIAGATAADFILSPSTAADDADYRCRVSNAQGSADSRTVHLTLLPPTPGSVYRESDLGLPPDASVHDLRFDVTGGLIAVGGFSKWDNIARPRVARLLPGSSAVDTAFDTSTLQGSLGTFGQLLPLSSGQTLVLGALVVDYQGQSHREVLRLNGNGSLDLTFNPHGSGGFEVAGDLGTRPAQGPDDKPILFGTQWNGEALGGSYFRLHADGTRDVGFALRGSSYLPVGPVVAALPDGRYLVGAKPTTAGAPLATSGIMRLLANGTPDPSFFTGNLPNGFQNNGVYDLLVQPDGRILVGGTFFVTDGQGTIVLGIIRLLADGQPDPSFNPVPSLSRVGDFGFAGVRRLALQGDGRIVAVGTGRTSAFPRNQLFRFWPNGALDPEFQVDVNSSATGTPSLLSLAVSGDNAVYVGGAFTQFGGLARTNFARVNGGPLSPAPAAPGIGSVPVRLVAKAGTSQTFTVEPAGTGPFQFQWRRNLATGVATFTDLPGATNASLTLADLQVADSGLLQVAVINPGGAVFSPFLTFLVEPDPAVPGKVDASFAPQPVVGLLTGLNQLTASNPDGTLYASVNGAVIRVFEDGTRDVTFAPPADLIPAGGNYGVSALCRQPDGKLLVAGRFSNSALVRLRADGSLDPTFNRSHTIAGGAQDLPQALAVQSDGRILIAGTMSNFGGRPVTGLCRLLANGDWDDSFPANQIQAVQTNPPRTMPGTVIGLRMLPDDRFYIGGGFSEVGGAVRHGVARLLPDGSLDPAFVPPTTGAVAAGTAGSMQFHQLGPVAPGAGVYIFGEFQPAQSGPRYTGLRLRADGSLDDTFHANTDFQINTGALQPDGKLIISGQYTKVDNVPWGHLARLNSNGTLDPTFESADSGTGVGVALTWLPDGKLLAGGQRYFAGAGSGVTPPALGFTLKSNGLELTWATGFKLQRTPTLVPATWQDVQAAAPFTVPLTGPSQFYRLVQSP